MYGEFLLNSERTDGELRARALAHLRDILDGTRKGKDKKLSQIIEAKSEVLSRYQRVFSDKNLPRLAPKEFREFLSIKNNHHWDGISRNVGTITEDMDALRRALLILLDESQPLRERLDSLHLPSGGKLIKGLGEATFTPILFVRYPEKYGVYNKTLVKALETLGLWEELSLSATRFSDRYIKVNKLMLSLAEDLGIDLWTLDALWWRVKKRPLTPNGPIDPRNYSVENAHQDLFIPRVDFERMLASINFRKNLILQGPPGTGKTFVARRIAWCLIGRIDNEPIEMIQFHQSYAYEDFVEGFRPTREGGFDLQSGVFHRFCERARANPETPHVFIIDEINRGNLSRVFGELLMLIERDKRSEKYAVKLTYSNKRFHVPKNVYILGMMNTADRSLALVDYALRRRFAFETVEPAYGTDYGRSAFSRHLTERGAQPDLARFISDRMGKLNETIRRDRELGPGFQVGHSYFVPDDEGPAPTEEWYRHVIDTQIAPLLCEYWFDSPEDVENEVAKLTNGP